MAGFFARWRKRRAPSASRPASPLFRTGTDEGSPVELGGEIELRPDEFADVEQVRAELARLRPADANAATAGLWDEVEAALDQEGLRLPPAPDSILRAQSLLNQPEASIGEIASLLESDPALVTKFVGVANSPFFGGLDDVSSAQDAIVRLGLRQTQHLLLTIALRGRVLRVRVKGFEAAPRELWRQASATAATAQLLGAIAGIDPDAAFLAGLVQEMGRAAVLSAASEAQHRLGPSHPLPKAAVEHAMDVLHAPLGGLLCRSWHLPAQIAGAVAYHHSPGRAPEAAEPLARVLRAAAILSEVLEGQAELDSFSEAAAMVGVNADEVETLVEDAREAVETLRKQL